MIGFIKAFHSAKATIDGIEAAHKIIGKGQLSEENIPTYKQFMVLAGKFYPEVNVAWPL